MRLLSFSVCSFFLFSFYSVSYSEDGKNIFLKYKCNKCHTVKAENIEKLKKEGKEEEGEQEEKEEKGEKIKAPDLSGVGLEADTAWFKKWLKKEVEKEFDGKKKKHRVKWKGTDEELEKLVNWLTTLKKK